MPPIQNNTSSSHDTDRPESQSPQVPDNTDHPGYQDTEQPTAEHPSDYRPQLEDIPELEDEENWEEGQFMDADFIDHHNTTEESDRLSHEYSAHFEKVTEQGYSPYNNTMPGLEYQIPEPEYFNSDIPPNQRYQNPNVYLPPLPSTEDLRRWYGHGCGRAKHLELHTLESRIARKHKKNQHQRERRSTDI